MMRTTSTMRHAMILHRAARWRATEPDHDFARLPPASAGITPEASMRFRSNESLMIERTQVDPIVLSPGWHGFDGLGRDPDLILQSIKPSS
ncbi:hypothetical protein AVEN_79927-1 [Araneus ventricosus]|uniref:Uncharacterized protein n=1 Tax=Araneus ventricosus TaxID=182803 RepID=A0A4Y2LK56_ARAVE|nr:hypothetical protein AVEN_79927-1 [Araneus ventricosus]